MKRTVIKIDEALCNGCGNCVSGCHEGALQLINGKAVMVSDLFCDGLGACIGDCPVGAIELIEKETEPYNEVAVMKRISPQPSQLRQWPVQLHLLNPAVSFFQSADVLLASDCSAFSHGSFHSTFLKNKTLAIACPKLDNNLQSYEEKLVSMIDDAKINTLTVLMMEVPCCGGLLNIARKAREKANRNVPVKAIVLSVRGEIISEDLL